MRTITTFITLLFFTATFSQFSVAPNQSPSEGPFYSTDYPREQLLINGNGAPPIGPVDISS